MCPHTLRRATTSMAAVLECTRSTPAAHLPSRLAGKRRPALPGWAARGVIALRPYSRVRTRTRGTALQAALRRGHVCLRLARKRRCYKVNVRPSTRERLVWLSRLLLPSAARRRRLYPQAPRRKRAQMCDSKNFRSRETQRAKHSPAPRPRPAASRPARCQSQNPGAPASPGPETHTLMFPAAEPAPGSRRHRLGGAVHPRAQVRPRSL